MHGEFLAVIYRDTRVVLMFDFRYLSRGVGHGIDEFMFRLTEIFCLLLQQNSIFGSRNILICMACLHGSVFSKSVMANYCNYYNNCNSYVVRRDLRFL